MNLEADVVYNDILLLIAESSCDNARGMEKFKTYSIFWQKLSVARRRFGLN